MAAVRVHQPVRVLRSLPGDVHTPEYATRRGGDAEFADNVYPVEPTQITMKLIAAHHDQLLREADLQP